MTEGNRDRQDFYDAFKAVPKEFRPVPFWSWNEKMNPVEVERQVQEIKNAGWGGGFVHSRIGLTTPYLSDEWFAAVDAAVDACKKAGISLWLYDEDKWPSGFSGGSVPLADETFRMKVLVGRPEGYVLPGGTRFGIPAHGIQTWLWVAPLGQAWFNGTCYADMGNRQAVSRFIEAAYAAYYRRYAGEYGSLITAEFTDETCMLFRIGVPYGAVPFSSEMEARFEAMHGYALSPEVVHLFLNEPDSMRFRLHYYRTLNDLFENNFSRQVGEWCGTHGIALTGHYMNEQGLFAQQNWGVKIMPNYRHQQIPGIDCLGRRITERITAKQCQSVVNQMGRERMLSELYGVAGGSLSFEDRRWIALQQICLGVNLLNPHLSLYTMAGCRKRDFPQNMFYQQPWWPLNGAVDVPLARLCYAMSRGKYAAELLVLHPGESAFALWQAQTEPVPDEPLTTFDDRETHSIVNEQRIKLERLDNELLELIDGLLASHRPFDFGDETIVAQEGRIGRDNGRVQLRVGQMAYRAVVMPSMTTLSRTVFELLREFCAAGGRVFRCGTAPERLDGMVSEELKEWTESLPCCALSELPELLDQWVVPAVRIEKLETGNRELIWSHPRDMEDGRRLVLLVNLDRFESAEGIVFFSGGFNAAVRLRDQDGDWQPEPGEPAADGLRLKMRIPPAQALLLELTSEVPAQVPATASAVCREEQVLTGWQVRRMDDNALTLDYAFWKEGGAPRSAQPIPVIAVQERLNRMGYDGPLVLTYPFRMKGLARDRKVHLVVEYPDRCRIRINGSPIRCTGLPYWRDIRWLPIEVTGLLREGENEVELQYEAFQHGDLTQVEDHFARYGTEIESVYLVGDFSVEGGTNGRQRRQSEWTAWGLPERPVHEIIREELCVAEPVSLMPRDASLQELPFYAGRLEFETQFAFSEVSGCASGLRVEGLDAAVAEVFINEQFAGTIYSAPYEVETGSLLRNGENQIKLVLYSTLRNLLGPHHEPRGELCHVGPRQFMSKETVECNDPADRIQAWGSGRFSPPDWNPDYCIVGFGFEKAFHYTTG